MTRREERTEAFKIVFQNLFVNKNDLFTDEENEKLAFKNLLIKTVEDNKEDLINFIKQNITEEKFARLYVIDLAIILLALAEIKFNVTPKEVAVNEAVEIAKIYSTEESPAFINGFLKALTK